MGLLRQLCGVNRGVDLTLKPIQIGPAPFHNRQGNDFRNFVGMVPAQGILESSENLRMSFNHHHDLA